MPSRMARVAALPLALMATLLLLVLASGGPADAASHAPIVIHVDSAFNATNGVTSGSGTAADPYVISGWEIGDNGTCIDVEGVASSFVIREVAIYSPGSGETNAIRLVDLSYVTVVLDNVTVQGPDRNVLISRCSDVTLRNLTIGNSSVLTIWECSRVEVVDVELDHDTGSIKVTDSRDLRFTRCRVLGMESTTGTSTGFYFMDVSNVSLYECNASRHYRGLSAVRVADMDVVDCDFWDNVECDVIISSLSAGNRLNRTRMGPQGLKVEGSVDVDVDRSNTVSGKAVLYLLNETDGIDGEEAGQVFMARCWDLTLSNMTVEGPCVALWVYSCRNITFSNVTASATHYCIYMSATPGSSVTGCQLSGMGQWPDGCVGISDSLCQDLAVVNTTFSGLQVGISSGSTYYVPSVLVVRGCTFSGMYTGVGLMYVNQSVIEGCAFEKLNCSISTAYVISIRVANSTLDGPRLQGIILMYTDRAEIVGNVVHGAQYGIFHWDGELRAEGNKVSGCSVSGLLSRQSSIRLANNTWEDCAVGLNLSVIDSLIMNDTTKSCGIGAYLWNGPESKNLTFVGCAFLDSTVQGLSVAATYVSLVNCTVDGSPTGLLTYWSGTVSIVGCTVSNCTVGVDLQGGSSRINGSLFMDCTYYGVRVNSSSTRVYWNTFLRTNYDAAMGSYKGPQAACGGSATFWNEDNEGNWWMDYRERYPSATVVNFKFWDTPYQLDGANKFDRFPLAIPLDLVPPIAEAGDNVTVPQGTNVTFDGRGSSDDVGIVTWTWTFRYDGLYRNLEGEVANYTFFRTGTYHAALKVWDAWGNMASDLVYITVLDVTPPVVDTGGDIEVGQREEFELDATGSRDNVGITSFLWNVDPDGLNLTFAAARAPLSIAVVGVYIATVNVTDTGGNWATASVNITVRDVDPPVAVAGADVEVDQGTVVTFNGTGSSDNVLIANLSWTFSHGGVTVVLEGERPSFTFATPGTYVVTLRVVDPSGLSSEDRLTVVVRDSEPPVAAAGADVRVEPGTLVALDGSASTDNVGLVSWSWSFVYGGAEVRFETPSFEFLFDTVGRYVVTLTVADERGNRASDDVVVLVVDSIPPVAVAGPDVEIDQHLAASFNGGLSTDEMGVARWVWTVGDGDARVTIEGVRASHVFDQAGAWTVTLEVFDGAGNSANDTLVVTVLDITPPFAEAGPDQAVDQGTRFILDGDLSTDNVAITSYAWTFTYGGGSVSLHGRTEEFTFSTPGVYKITLRVEDATGLSSTDSMTLTVRDTTAPVATLAMSPEGDRAARGTRCAMDGSRSTDNVGVVNWTWTVARDGQVVATLHGRTAEYALGRDGLYEFNLTVQDAAGNAASDSTQVLVRTPREGMDGLALTIVAALAAAALVAVLIWRRSRARGR